MQSTTETQQDSFECSMVSPKELPFVVPPKPPETELVGNENCGTLAIPKYGYLTTAEKQLIRKMSKNLPDLRREAIRMAKAIAKQSGKKITEVYDALTKQSQGTEILENFAEEAIELQDLIEESEPQRVAILVTAIIKTRVLKSWTTEDTNDPDKIHPELVTLIAEFAQRERSKQQEAVEPGNDSVVESEASSPEEA